MIVRKFNNVGNALFVVEKIGNKTFVYDCGGEKGYIPTAAIHSSFAKGEEIEAVFISHYDSDHINGIYDLLKYCNVKRLILPMMSDAIRFLLLILQRYETNLEGFIINTEEYVQSISPDTKISYVYDNREDDRQSVPQTRSFESVSGMNANFSTGTRLISEQLIDWVFIPMCIRILSPEEETDFIDELYNLLGIPLSKRCTVKELWETYNLCHGKEGEITSGGRTRNKIKNALKKIFPKGLKKKINEYSQTLYSGPMDYTNPDKRGCLYLGDYNAKIHWNELNITYGAYANNIKIIQIPHHGSEKSFNENIINAGTISVISAALDGDIAMGNTMSNIVNRHSTALVTASVGDIYIYSCGNTAILFP